MPDDPVTSGVPEPVIASSGGGGLAGLRQKTLFRIAAAYAVAAWLVIQVVATVAPAFELAPWVVRAVILFAVLGFIATVGYFGFLRRERGETAGLLRRRGRIASLVAVGAVLISVIVGAAYIARTTLFADEQVTLAVLPFDDLSPGRDKAYFAEGVGEEILSALAANKDFKVLGRISARQIERDPDPKAIRATLGVTHLLEGSARTSDDQLRVNVRLIDTSDGSQLWEEEYDGRMADIFAVQDKIAGAVVGRLRGTFFEGEVRAAMATTVEAYRHYLAARALMRTRSEPSLREALALAAKVVRADPNYAPGHALMAELFYLLSDDITAYGTMPLEQARKVGVPLAREAIRLAPKIADGYGALGLLLPREQALEPLRRALNLDPSRADVRIWRGVTLAELGRHDEALVHFQTAVDIDPLAFAPVANLVQALSAAERDKEALHVVQQFRRRGGDEALLHPFRMLIAHGRGDWSGVIMHGRMALARGSMRHAYYHRALAGDLYALGFGQEAARILPSGLANFHAPYYAGDVGQLRRNIERQGPRIWRAKDGGFAFVHLAAIRDWPSLRKLHDARPFAFTEFCQQSHNYAAPLVMAFRANDRNKEAADILQCLRKRLAIETRQKARLLYAWPADLEFRRATLSALDGDRGQALHWLSNAVTRGWLGQPYSSRIADYPQFDPLKGDRRIAELQTRIDRMIATERSEVLALKPTA